MPPESTAAVISREADAVVPCPFVQSNARPLRLPEESAGVMWFQNWRTIRRNWKLVAAVTAAGAAVGLLISAVQTPLYHARTTIEIQGINDNLLKSQDGNPNAGVSAEMTDIQTQVRIMQSESLVRGVAANLETRENASPERRKFLNQAIQSLRAVAIPQTRLIEITADSSDARVAADFVNATAAGFIEQHVEERWRGTQNGTQKLSLALDEMRVRYEKSQDDLQAYARDSRLLLTDDRNSVSEEKLRENQSELARAQADRVTKQSRLEAVTNAAKGDLASVLNDPAITAMQEQLTAIRRQVAELATIYTPGYPKVQRLEAQVAPLELAIQTRSSGIVDRIQSEYQEARRREELVTSVYQNQAGLVSEEAGKKVHYDVLKREADSNRILYDTMLARVKEAGIASAMRASNVRVVDLARKPEHRSQPHPGQLLLMGSLAGLFLGAAFTVSRDQTIPTIQAPGDLALFLNIPEFGVVPASRPAIPASPLPIAIGESQPELTDSFRAILASLLFSFPEGQPRVLAITSANPGEGKTTIACNLAMALAEVGRRVLLIDGDLRSPRLHDIFRTTADNGLSDLLACSTPLNQAQITSCIRHAGSTPLHLLPCGNAANQSSANLHSPRLAELFEFARKNFDIVLVDTPPMLQIPDARVIGRVSDAVVMVVRSGKTARDAAQAVRQRLAEDGTTMTGSVLNGWNPKHSPGYYGNYSSVRRSSTNKQG